MKIAIVAPSPVPFVVGGAEKLWWGMQDFINKQTSHNCELLKLPVREKTVYDLIHSYYSFYQMDLDYFDMVISTKYPAFMVQHPNHHLYLQHLLRGLYDAYPANLPLEFIPKDSETVRLISLISRPDIGISDIFEELFDFIEARKENVDINCFPGSFIRKIIHIFDRRAMENVKSFSCISETVQKRKEYFPPLAPVEVIHHPSNINNYNCKKGKYFFTASRLDRPKRVELIIKSYLKSDMKFPLIIAGTGPEEKKLKAIAGNDSRIKFVGFVSDSELVEYYSEAVAVIFVPYDEDYGLITYEALASGKPVITTDDSGGVTELIEDNLNGYIAEPAIESIADKLNKIESLIHSDTEKICRKSIEKITWENLISKILNKENKKKNYRKKIVALSTYPVSNPISGGQLRTFHLLKRLSDKYDIIILSLSDSQGIVETEINFNFKEIEFPETKAFVKAKKSIEDKIGISAKDIAFMINNSLLQDYHDKFLQLAESADAVMCVQPYTYLIANEYFEGKIIHESQNVEYFLKRQMVSNKDEEIFKILYYVEKSILRNSDLNILCTHEDAEKFKELYKLNNFEYYIVPNGVDAKNTIFFDKFSDHREFYHENSKSKNVIFAGSWHQPNVDAVFEIIKMAEEAKDIFFNIVGTVGLYFEKNNIKVPDNVFLTGMVSNEEKFDFFRKAHIAINPMLSGSGSNLKIAEYLSSGLPVVSTKIGCRGYGDKINNYVVIVDLDNFIPAIRYRFENIDKSKLIEGRKYILENFDWDVIAAKYPDI